MSKQKRLPLQNAFALGVTLASTFLGYGRRVYAGCYPAGSPGTYLCYGANSAPLSFTSSLKPYVSVTTQDGFSVLVSTDIALKIAPDIGNGVPGSIHFFDAYASTITGTTGIYASMTGIGPLTITTNGTVTGTVSDGIYAKNSGYQGSSANTIIASNVYGATYGIKANITSPGALLITTTGNVTGTQKDGIYAKNNNDLAINTVNVSGYTDGIRAQTFTGSLKITSTGTVTGKTQIGIDAFQVGFGNGVSIDVADVSGYNVGIAAQTLSGYLKITSTGTVKALTNNDPSVFTGNGINIFAQQGCEGVTIQVNNVYGTNYGIFLLNDLAVKTTITTTGNIAGTEEGIYSSAGGDLTINLLSGSSISGGQAAIHSAIANNTTIVNNGTIQNSSTSSSDQSISLAGDASITNNSIINGTVSLRGAKNTFTNNGTWNTTGQNYFYQAGANDLTNNGTISAVDASATSQTITEFYNLTSFNNAGTITIQNGFIGNQLVITSNFVGSGNSQIQLNTTLGADNSPTDLIVLSGANASATGTTGLVIHNVDGAGSSTTGDGIMVVSAESGATTSPTAFKLNGRVAAGAYEYKLYQGGASGSPAPSGLQGLMASGPTTPSPNQSWFLRSTSFRDEVPVSLTAPILVQQFGLTMLDTLDDRVGSKVLDSKGLYNTGAWARIIGETGNRNQNGDFAKYGPTYHWDMGGIQLGYDIYRRTHQDQSSDVVGADFAYGQVNSNIQNTTNTAKAGDMRVNGYTFGGYWTHYGASGWYSDAIFQGTDYSNFRVKTVSGGGFSTSGAGYLGSLEGGWALNYHNLIWVTPEAQVIYQQVNVSQTADNFGLYRFDNADALFGRIGGRVSKNWAVGDKLRQLTTWARVNLWHDFSPQSNVAFLSLAGTNAVVLPANYGENWVQLSLGASSQLQNGVSLFASGDYSTFFSGMQGNTWSGRLGVKYVR